MVCVRKSETSTHNAPREPLKGETLGRAQRVDMCREPGDLPYLALRRPFEGKGRQHVCADPDRSRLGFFYACCFPCRVGQPFFLPCGGRGGEGEASRGSSRSVASLYPLFHLTRDVSHVCWGCSTVCRRTSTCGSSRMGRLPSWVYGLRDLSGGEPVRLSVRHTGSQCGSASTRPSGSQEASQGVTTQVLA